MESQNDVIHQAKLNKNMQPGQKHPHTRLRQKLNRKMSVQDESFDEILEESAYARVRTCGNKSGSGELQINIFVHKIIRKQLLVS